jgi:hypothetical protein
MRLAALMFACLGIGLPALGATGSAIQILGERQGPRQAALGGAGVAMPGKGRATRFNPALAGLGFAPDRRAIEWHPAWKDYSRYTGLRLKDWNGPAYPTVSDLGPMYGSLFFRWPGLYMPRWGYLGYDRQTSSTSWMGVQEEVQTLTVSLAEDFLGSGRPSSQSWGWTGGLAGKRWSSGILQLTEDATAYEIKAEGFALDLGWAASGPGPAFLPGTDICLGFAFFNLGRDAEYTGRNGGPSGLADPIPMEYRLGLSGIWTPFAARTVLGRAVVPVRALATAEAGKEFANRDSRQRPLNPFLSFFQDFRSFPGRYLRETTTHAGVEATVFGVASLRYGRMGVGEYEGDKDYWYYGWGLDTGPWLRNFGARFDYARQLSTRHVGGYLIPSRQYGFDLEARF